VCLKLALQPGQAQVGRHAHPGHKRPAVLECLARRLERKQ